MLTVLQIAQRALDEIGIIVPASIISTTDANQRQINALIRSAAESLRSKRTFTQQKKEYSFETVAGRTKYPLPEDYYAACLDTAWDVDRQWRLIGPISDSQFQESTYGILRGSNEIAFKIFGPDVNPTTGGGQFQITPEPTAGGELDLTFNYITRNLFLPPLWTVSTAYTSGGYCSSNGNIYKCKTSGTSHATTPPSATSGDITDGTAVWNYISAPYETIISNSDLCMFDDDLMVAELKWRYLRAKKKDYAQELSDAAAMLETSVTRSKGPYIGSLAGPRRARRYSIPEGGWNI